MVAKRLRPRLYVVMERHGHGGLEEVEVSLFRHANAADQYVAFLEEYVGPEEVETRELVHVVTHVRLTRAQLLDMTGLTEDEIEEGQGEIET